MSTTKTIELPTETIQLADPKRVDSNLPSHRDSNNIVHVPQIKIDHTEDHTLHTNGDTEHFTPAQEKRFRLEGWRVIIGGVFIHLVLGTFYLWGSISVYIASYLRAHNSEVTLNVVKMVFPLMNVAINSTLSFGVKLAAIIGHKLMATAAIFLIAATVFLVSWITNFWAFLFIYAILLGVSSGMVYMVPVVCGLRYFPTRKGDLLKLFSQMM